MTVFSMPIDTTPIDALVHQLNTNAAVLGVQQDWSALSDYPAVRLTGEDLEALHQIIRIIYTHRTHLYTPPPGTPPSISAATSPHPRSIGTSMHGLAVSTLHGLSSARWPGSLVVQFEACQVTGLVLRSCGLDTSTRQWPRLEWLGQSPDVKAAASRVVLATRAIIADLRAHCPAVAA